MDRRVSVELTDPKPGLVRVVVNRLADFVHAALTLPIYG